jgi:hypothetical protein
VTGHGQSFTEACRELVGQFRRDFRRNKLKAIVMSIGFLVLLIVVFLFGFFLFGGWVIFDDRLPDWVGRLFIFLVVVLVAWSFLKPAFDRWGTARAVMTNDSASRGD